MSRNTGLLSHTSGGLEMDILADILSIAASGLAIGVIVWRVRKDNHAHRHGEAKHCVEDPDGRVAAMGSEE